MDQLINDLAIIITRKIETDLIHAFYRDRMSPSTINIREVVYRTLVKYMGTIGATSHISDEARVRMSDEEYARYCNHEMEVSAHSVLVKIMKDPDFFAKFEQQNSWSRIGTTYRDIIVLRTNKIMQDSKLTGEEMLWEMTKK